MTKKNTKKELESRIRQLEDKLKDQAEDFNIDILKTEEAYRHLIEDTDNLKARIVEIEAARKRDKNKIRNLKYYVSRLENIIFKIAIRGASNMEENDQND